MKTIESPSKRFPGTVALPDYLAFPKLLKWDKAIKEAKKLEGEDTVVEFYDLMLPAVLDIVQEWHLQGLPEQMTIEAFPASMELIGWLTKAVTELYQETNSIDPNSPGQ